MRWIEPFARPGLLARTVGRAYGAALIAFSPIPVLSSLARPIALPVLFGMLAFAGILVPILMLAFDRRAVTIDDAVRVRGARGALSPRTIGFPEIERAEIAPERALGATRAFTLRLFRAAPAGGAATELAAVGLSERNDPQALASALTARGVRASVVARPSARDRRLGVPVAVLLLLLAGTVWSIRAVGEIVAARPDAEEPATAVAIRCLTVAPGGRLSIRVVSTGTLLDVRVGPKRYPARELRIERDASGETVLGVDTGNLDPRTQKFVSVSAGQPDHSVDSDGAPFDPTDDRPQGPHC